MFYLKDTFINGYILNLAFLARSIKNANFSTHKNRKILMYLVISEFYPKFFFVKQCYMH